MKKIVLTALFCVFLFLECTTSYAQLNSQGKNSSYYRLAQGTNVTAMEDGNYIPGVDGSPYLSEEWTKGRITMSDGTIIDTIDLRLNVYKNEMRYLDKGVEYSIGIPENIKEIAIRNRKFVYYPYKNGKNISHGYFEVLVEGKTELLVLFYITRMKADYNAAFNIGNKNDHLKLGERYFICTGSSIVEIDKKGENLFASIGEKSIMLRQKTESEGLFFKKKVDLVRIVSYLNTIN